MSTVRKITPEKEKAVPMRTERGLKPFAHGMEEFFENLFGDFPRRWTGAFKDPFRANFPLWHEFARANEVDFPRIDMVDREKDLFIRAELPGVRKEDLEITVLGDRLMIKGTREFKEEEEEETFFRAEMGYGVMARTIMLPMAVDEKKVEAKLKDGILELTLPKVEVHKRHVVKVA